MVNPAANEENMSIELRRNSRNELECGWGTFENGEADPKRGLRHLVLITTEWVKQLLTDGPAPNPRGGITSATSDGERIFAHLDYDGDRWTWELFDAHWWDNGSPDIMVGRWPD